MSEMAKYVDRARFNPSRIDWIMKSGHYMPEWSQVVHNKTIKRVRFEFMLTLKGAWLLLSCSQMVFWEMMFASLVGCLDSCAPMLSFLFVFVSNVG